MKRKGSITSSHCLVCSDGSWERETELLTTGKEQTIPVGLGKISITATALLLWAKSRGKTGLGKEEVVNNSYSLQVVSPLLSLICLSLKLSLSPCLAFSACAFECLRVCEAVSLASSPCLL